jgi:predicted nucleic acid-binding protein
MGTQEPEPVEQFVLDGSVALAWFFEDEASDYADAVARRLPMAQAVVPAIWPLEVTNALLVGERRRRCTQTDTHHWTQRLQLLPIVVDGGTYAAAFGDTLNLARIQGLSAYDAAYLELCMRQGIPLATLDDRLRRAATNVGVALYNPA